MPPAQPSSRRSTGTENGSLKSPATRPHFVFSSDWHLPYGRERVWALLADPPGWPEWWPGLLDVRPLQRPDGALSGWAFQWRGQLPHTLRVSIRLIESTPPQRMVGEVEGELEGIARWQLSEDGHATRVRFDWHVSGPAWAGWLAPLLRGGFRRNFDRLMQQGCLGLSERLAAVDAGA